MRFISSIVGASTDTSRNHEYTDWGAVDTYAEEFAETVAAQ
jgi:menaquinone-dependent protoporphyrinogen IX oxidase